LLFSQLLIIKFSQLLRRKKKVYSDWLCVVHQFIVFSQLPANFKKRLESLKTSMIHIDSLLEQDTQFLSKPHRWDPCKSFYEEVDQRKNVLEL
jgi:hypothetical protein